MYLQTSSQQIIAGAVLLSGVMAITGAAKGATIAAIDFEAPDYTPGSLENQQGWESVSHATVVSPSESELAAASGDQYMAFNSTFNARAVNTFLPEATTEPVSISFLLALELPFAGSSDRGGEIRINNTSTFGGMEIHFNRDGDIMFRTTSNSYETFVSGDDVSAQTWYRFEIDYAGGDGDDQVDIRVYDHETDQLVGELLSAPYRSDGNAGINRIDIRGASSSSAVGPIYFDDFRVIPEPASASLLMASATCFLWRRRQRR